jgi:DNA-binding MarR family transcriptional regulator
MVNLAAIYYRREINQQFKDAELNLTSEQWTILALLKTQNGQNLSELSIAADKDKAGITRIVRVLENKGLVLRKQLNGNKKVSCIYLTNKGKKNIIMIFPILQIILEKATKNIKPEELELANNVLGRLITNLS